MQLSAPCRLVEMVAEVLGLEYEFIVVSGNSDNLSADMSTMLTRFGM